MSVMDKYRNQSGPKGDFDAPGTGLVRILDYHIEGDKNTKSPNDYIDAVLLDNLGTLKAEFDPKSGEPLTKVKLVFSDKVSDKTHSMAQMRVGNHIAKPLPPGSTIMVQDAKSKGNTIDFRRVVNANDGFLLSTMSNVKPEREFGGKKQQDRGQLFKDEDIPVTDLDSLKKAILTCVTNNPDYPGDPGVVMVAVEMKEPDYDSVAFFYSARWDKEAGRLESPDAMVEGFLAKYSEAVADLVGQQNVALRVMPYVEMRTGFESLPSSKREHHPTYPEHILDDAVQFARPNESGRNSYMWAMASTVLGKNEKGEMFVKSTHRNNKFGPLYATARLPSRHLPEAVNAKFEAEGIENAKQRGRLMFNRNDASDVGAEPEPEAEEAPAYGV